MQNRRYAVGIMVTVMFVFAVMMAAAGLRASAKPAGEASYWGFDTANLDRACKPCDDFYQFAMGGWMKSHAIPPEYSTWGSFSQLVDKNQQNLREILDAAVKQQAKPGSNEQKIGDFYASCMDTEAIEAAGTKPMDTELADIAQMKNGADLLAEAARLQTEGVGVLFGFRANQDAKDSTQVVGTAWQGGLGLPEREYYLKQDDKSKQLRDAYVEHVAKMFELAGDSAPTAAAEANTVLGIETSLATASMKNTDLRDPNKTYHRMKMRELQALTPDFNWESYFKVLGHPELNEINVGQPDFFRALDSQLTASPLADWKTYYRWHLLNAAAPALPEKFVAEEFEFRGKTLTERRRFSRAGSAARRPPTGRWEKPSASCTSGSTFRQKPRRTLW
jgi:putative endopeptidase